MRSNAKLYPQTFYQILLLLKEDGTPLRLPFASRDQAVDYRFKYYNFLKWCRRPLNSAATAHLQGRYNMVEVKLDNSELVFSLRTQQRFAAIDHALATALTAQGHILPDVPREFLSPTRGLPHGEALPKDWALDPTEQRDYPIPSFKEEGTLAPATILDEHAIPEGTPTGGDWMKFLEGGLGRDTMARDTQRLLETQAEATAERAEAAKIKRVGWYPGDTVLELSLGERHNPRSRFGRIIDVLIFENRPVEMGDDLQTEQHFQEYSDLIMECGFMGAIQLERTLTGFRFNLAPEVPKMLRAFGWVSARIEHCVTWQDQNIARAEIKSLILEHIK